LDGADGDLLAIGGAVGNGGRGANFGGEGPLAGGIPGGGLIDKDGPDVGGREGGVGLASAGGGVIPCEGGPPFGGGERVNGGLRSGGEEGTLGLGGDIVMGAGPGETVTGDGGAVGWLSGEVPEVGGLTWGTLGGGALGELARG
jgi:hypothetical protein